MRGSFSVPRPRTASAISSRTTAQRPPRTRPWRERWRAAARSCRDRSTSSPTTSGISRTSRPTIAPSPRPVSPARPCSAAACSTRPNPSSSTTSSSRRRLPPSSPRQRSPAMPIQSPGTTRPRSRSRSTRRKRRSTRSSCHPVWSLLKFRSCSTRSSATPASSPPRTSSPSSPRPWTGASRCRLAHFRPGSHAASLRRPTGCAAPTPACPREKLGTLRRPSFRRQETARAL